METQLQIEEEKFVVHLFQNWCEENNKQGGDLLHTRIRLFPSKVPCYDNSQCWSYMELLAAKGLQLEICSNKVRFMIFVL
jgi:hypothetical protein